MITSSHNDKLKEVRRLQRRRDARFVAEGEDLLAAARDAGWPAVYELHAGVDVEPELLDQVSSLGSGTRALGVYEQRWGAPAGPLGVSLHGVGGYGQRGGGPAGPLCLYLHGVGDPGNVGTILRSALAFGDASVVLGPD